MYTKNANNQGSAPHFLLIGFLVIGIIVFVGAIVSQNFSLFSEAASSEPSCKRGQTTASVIPSPGRSLAGGLVYYSLRVRNTDSVGCGPTYFDITFKQPQNVTLQSYPTRVLIDSGSVEVALGFSLKSTTSISVGRHTGSIALTGTDPLHSVATQYLLDIVKQGSPSQPPVVINNKPVITTRFLPNATINTPYSATVDSQDPDGDDVSLSLSNLPAGLNSTCARTGGTATAQNNNRTICTISGIPTAIGLTQITAVATDSKGSIATRNINLRVLRAGILRIIP